MSKIAYIRKYSLVYPTEKKWQNKMTYPLYLCCVQFVYLKNTGCIIIVIYSTTFYPTSWNS